jgi:glycerol-3-phosphate acyltransferase PlsY
VVGHVLSVFVRFRGGKGVATAAGVMLGFSPLAVGIAAAVWAAVVFTTGYVSLGSMIAAATLPIVVRIVRPDDWQLFWADVLVVAAIIWLHRANITRLIAGTESRFGRRRTAAPPAG